MDEDIALAPTVITDTGFLHFNQLKNNLLVQVNQLLVPEIQHLDHVEHRVLVAGVDVGREGILAVHGVERDPGLLQQKSQGPCQVALLHILLDQTNYVG